jgi:hypothetical protein
MNLSSFVMSDSNPLPPFTLRRPSEDAPRSADEVFDEYMDFRQAVVDFFRDGHFDELEDAGDGMRVIDDLFCIERRKYMRSQLDRNLEIDGLPE